MNEAMSADEVRKSGFRTCKADIQAEYWRGQGTAITNCCPFLSTIHLMTSFKKLKLKTMVNPKAEFMSEDKKNKFGSLLYKGFSKSAITLNVSIHKTRYISTSL